jgi:hypothetical protein
VVSLQINTAGIMAMNRVDRIVLDPIRTYACTRTARTGVRVTVVRVKSCDNNSDIGTKRVSLPIFNKLLNQIIDQSQRRNL